MIDYQLSLITSITAVDVNLFPEYIFPAVKPFVTDRNPCARAAYAKCISLLGNKTNNSAESSLLFLDMSEVLKDDPSFDIEMNNTILQVDMALNIR
jgi:hypothetical protein